MFTALLLIGKWLYQIDRIPANFYFGSNLSMHGLLVWEGAVIGYIFSDSGYAMLNNSMGKGFQIGGNVFLKDSSHGNVVMTMVELTLRSPSRNWDEAGAVILRSEGDIAGTVVNWNASGFFEYGDNAFVFQILENGNGNPFYINFQVLASGGYGGYPQHW